MNKLTNKLTITTFLVLLSFFTLQTFAQNSGFRGINKATQLDNNLPAKETKVAKKVPDYVLYRNVIRRNLWLEGQGEPITQEVANKLPCYFRLSMKNSKGHYQFVEALQGKNLTSNHTVSPYIMDKRILTKPESTTGLWEERFATIGQWLITSDLNGERVVEERAYEAKAKDANLVYAFQPIYNDSIHVTGSYTDSWGLPIDINDTGDHHYGSVVYITLNKQGLDSIVDHIDAKGLCRYNQYGVDQTRYIYDDKGRLQSVSSHNTVGDPVNDNRGYHATLFEYNDKDNNCVVTHVDKNMKPVRPNNTTSDDDFVKKKIEYDKIGRIVRQTILE